MTPIPFSGHPPFSASRNGSTPDVDFLVESFSALGSHCLTTGAIILYILVPLYLLLVTLFPSITPEQCTSYLLNACVRRQTPSDEKGDVALDCTEHGPATGHGVRHLAVIMDGNRRYGKKKFGSGLRGHESGATALLQFIIWAKARSIPLLTVYAFSTENWNRPPHEVTLLMSLFRIFFQRMRDDAATHSIRVRFMVSDPTRLPEDIVALMKVIELETSAFGGVVVNVCVSYSGRGSLIKASQRLHHAGVAPTEERMRAELCRSLTEEAQPVPFDAPSVMMNDGTTVRLDADPEVLFRTSREQRVSNFMLFEIAYAELFFVDELWPEVSEASLDRVLRSFATARHRRFGR